MVLLVNPASGGGKAGKVMPAVRERLGARGIDFEEVTTRSAEHAIEEAERAFEAGALPVVVSGDGLIGAVGGALAGRGATIGIIPAGRGNDLARVMGIPGDPTAAAEVLVNGTPRLIDVGEANGRRFLCIASTGFDSEANRIANESRLIKGQAVYAYAALRALASWRPARFEIVLENETVEVTGYTVAVANSSAYGGGMFVAPDAKLDDGLFDIVTVATVGKLRFLANLPKVFSGSHVGNPEIGVYRAAKLELRADRPFALYADGEHLTDLPATIEVLPGALSLMAPAAEESDH